jgi:two-component system, OmpR family, phosphate regulon sensor histidine kinase PhoR
VQDYVPIEFRTIMGDVLLMEDWPMFRALHGERFTNGEVRYRGPDGQERILVFSGRPLLDFKGTLEYALLSFHRASSEQAARAELEQIARLADQRAQYVGSVLEAMTDSVLVCNQHGVLLLVNLAGKQMLGIDRARLLSGHYHLARFVTDFQVRTLSGQPVPIQDFPLMQALHGKTVHDVELTLRHPETGAEWQAHVSASPIKGHAEGAPVVGAVAVLVDVSKARALDRAKDEFLALSAHELKGPLTSIRGFAQLLRRGAKHAPQGRERRGDMQWVEKIEAQADRLGKLIEELTDAARADLGNFDLKVRLVPLGALLRRVAEAQQVTTERHRLTVDAPATGLFVKGDETRLEQVFSNLVTNAFKYSPAGGDITIVVKGLEEQQTPAPFVEIAIQDQGQGIAANDLERIFTRFTRAESVRGVQGLGLGLYIARGIIEAHGGTIHAESHGLGRGSTFVVQLPREKQHQPSPVGD